MKDEGCGGHGKDAAGNWIRVDGCDKCARNDSTKADADPNDEDSWLSAVREWRKSPRQRPLHRTGSGTPRKPERQQGALASFLTVAGIVLGALFLFGFVILNFNASDHPLKFAPDRLPATNVGDPYTVPIVVSGNASQLDSVELGRGALPPGLALVLDRNELDAVNNVRIIGNATTAGTYEFTLYARTSGGSVDDLVSSQSGSQDFVIVVN
jgi:hypothetical protein